MKREMLFLKQKFKSPQPNPTFLEGYKDWSRLTGHSENTIKCYSYSLRNIPENVDAYFSNKQLKGRRMKISAYRSYLNFLADEMDLLTLEQLTKILRKFKYPKRRGNNHSERKWSIPREEWTKYIKMAPHHIAKMGMWLGFQFGLRNGEIVHLRVNDISFENEEIIIRPRPKTHNTVAWVPKHNRTRTIPFVTKHAQVLERWINETRPKELGHYYLLWTPRNYNKVSEKNFWNWVKKVGANPHILRYSFATNLYEVTKDIKLVSDLLGHANVSITSDYLQLGHKQTMRKAREVMIDF
jgi:integrase